VSQDANTPSGETAEVAAADTLARFFFLKTTFAILLTIMLVAGGFMAYFNLTKESLPDLDIPQAIVTTVWPGADPQTIEEQVTQEIEDELATLKGLKSLSSSSFDSYSLIAVEFNAEADSNEAMQRLRESISDVEGELPADAEAPDIQQVSVDDRPILTIALYGAVSDVALNDLAEDIRDELETLSGVNEVDLGGARDEIVQILLQPEQLLSLGIPPTAVRDAIGSANLDQPFGEIEAEDFGAVIRLEGQFRSVEDLQDLPIGNLGDGLNQRTVTLGEVGSVERGLEREESRAYYSRNGGAFGETIEISVKKSPGADTVKLIEDIQGRLAQLSASNAWVDGVEYAVTQDEAEQIQDSLVGVFINGLQAMLAVFVILLLVLTWREGLIAGLSIPVSFAGVMIVIGLLGYTLNELVIIGMVLALGLIVDVFILMMEGLHEEIYANKKTFGQAVLATIKRYGMPAFAGQLTTILALVPLMAISGVSGKFIRVLPVTAVACLVVAFAVALLASVPLSRFLLGRVASGGAQIDETRADHIMAAASEKLNRWSSAHTLRSKKRAAVWVSGALAVFVASIFAISTATVELYPPQDGLNLGVNIELPPTVTLDESGEVAETVGEMLRDKPYFASIIKLVGRKSPLAGGSISGALQPSESENFIGFSIKLVEREDREAASYELENEIRDELTAYLSAHVPGASLQVVSESGGPSTGDPIEITITGDDMDELQRLSNAVTKVVAQVDGTVDVRDDLGSVKTQIALVPDRGAADFFGLTQRQLAAQIRFALSNDKVSTFATLGAQDDLDIRMSLEWQSRGGNAGGPRDISELAKIRAFTNSGDTVSLLQLLKPELSEAPTSVLHKGGERAITVLSKVENRGLAEVIADITPELDRLSEQWPPGYSWSIGGESEETAETFGSAGLMLVIALIMVFGVLVIVFGSFAQAVILMTTMPLALIGTFLGFWLFDLSLTFFAVVGLISLIGIVANNGIVMVDTMNKRMQDGAGVAQAAAEGASSRLRPIVTTSITTVAGLIPLAIGSPMYALLCYAIIFGLVASTLLSLVIVPCLYLLLTPEGAARTQSLD